MAFKIDDKLKKKYGDFEYEVKTVDIEITLTILDTMHDLGLLSLEGEHIREMYEYKFK